MPLTDYQESVDRIQRQLAGAFVEDPTLLNVPGRSLACKIDPNYYIALQPMFDRALGRWTGMRPQGAANILIKTALIITRPPERQHVLTVGVTWKGRTMDMQTTFLDADFIDRALKLYAAMPAGLEVSSLRIRETSRKVVEDFFQGKTPPDNVAYSD